MSKKCLCAVGCGLPLLSLALAMPAVAQEQETDSTDASEVAPAANVIIVTAQFREQNLQDTPLAITAVTGAEIQAKSQNNLAQVADSAPNVTLRPQGSSFGPSVTASIRGIGQNDFNPAYEPGVGIYIDDVYYPQLTGAIFDVLDLDRVEILRGPQGTLSGRNSIGGAIKLFSRRPEGDSSGFVEATYGARDRVSLRGAVDFALTDNLFVRVSGVAKEQDGYVNQVDFGCRYPAGAGDTFVNREGETIEINPEGGIPSRSGSIGSDCVVDKLGGIGYQALRGIVAWEPTPDLEITIIGDYTNDDRTVAGEILTGTNNSRNPNILPEGISAFDDRFICGPYCNFQVDGHPSGVFIPVIPTDPFRAGGTELLPFEGNNRSKYEGWGVSGQIGYDITDTLEFVSITGYRAFDTLFFADGDVSPVHIGYGKNDLSNWSFSQELRVNAELAETIFATLGVYYFEQKSVYDSVQDLRYVAPFPLQFRQPDPTKGEAKAIFANASWEMIEDFNINAGIRYTEESKEQTYFRYNLDGTINRFLDPIGAANGIGAPGALTGSTAVYEGDEIDYRIALDYRFSPAVLVYASVATGFKGGGSNPRPFNAEQLIAFGPEKLTAYELGAKTDFLNGDVRLNVSAFYNDYTDIQISVNTCPTGNPLTARPCAARLNAGDGIYKGLEAELTASPIEGLAIDGSLSYITFEYDEDSLLPSAAAPPFGTNPDGVLPSDPPFFVPEWKANLGAQYEFDLGAAGSITPRLDLFYQHEQYTGAAEVGGERVLNFLPSFTVLNGRLTWQNANEDLQIALEVTNITDEYYLLNTFDLRDAAGYKKDLPARPREWAVSVRKRFF